MKVDSPPRTENFIRVFDGVVADSLCCEIIARFDRDPDRFPGGAAGNDGNVVVEEKQTMELWIEKEGWEDVVEALRTSLFEQFEIYRREVKFLAGSDHRELRAESLRVKKYEPGGRFEWHIDNNCRRNFRRVLAAQWYFNTVDQGGHTEFEDQKVKVAPVAGADCILSRVLDLPPPRGAAVKRPEVHLHDFYLAGVLAASMESSRPTADCANR